MKKFLIGVLCVALLGVVVVVVGVFVIRAQLADTWPPDPGPIEMPYVVETTPEARAAVVHFAEIEYLGLPRAEGRDLRDSLQGSLGAPPPALGSAIPEVSTRVIPTNVNPDGVMTPPVLPGANPAVEPIDYPGPGDGRWDQVVEFLDAFAAIAHAGTFELEQDLENGVSLIGALYATQLVVLRARGWMGRGHAAESAADYLLALDVLQTLERSSTFLVPKMVAFAAERFVLRDIAATADAWPSQQRMDLIARLQATNSDPSYMAVMLVHESRFIERAIEFVASGGDPSGHLPVDHSSRSPMHSLLRLDSARTLALHRTQVGATLEAAMQPPSARVAAELTPMTEDFGWQVDNGIGRLMLGMLTFAWSRFLDEEDYLRTYRDLVVLRLGVAEFEATTGRTPDQLSELTNILGELPEDRFDFLLSAVPGYDYSSTEQTIASDFVDTRETWSSEVSWGE